MERENLGQSQMERAIREFGDQLKEQKGVGLFYYAGHGVQVEGENFLIPVGAQLEREDEVKDHTVNAGLVLRKMESARNGTNIVILDACRDNPFRTSWRSAQKGLATMSAPIGTFISYSTSPGKVAGDGAGRNGVYTGHLLTEMRTAGTPIELVFKRVRQRVVAQTGGKQVPWEATSLQGEFYFVPPAAAGETAVTTSNWVAAREVTSSVLASPAPIVPSMRLPKTEQRPAMLVIPAGTFTMGSPSREKLRGDDEQQHEVKLSRGFWLGQTEVTQRQWVGVMRTNPSVHRGMDLPVEQVSWFDALTYCNRLSQVEGLTECYKIEGEKVVWVGGLRCGGYRLPTEAEWEYAARAGQRTIYAGSDKLNDVAWYAGDSAGETHPVGLNTPNRWGLYDMSGNVWEWVWDRFGTYPDGTVTDPVGSVSGSYRVYRGGAWGSEAHNVRVAYRNDNDPSDRDSNQGFRLARSLP
jgi:formylglycine-generating enzyme required for sulfatase activity